MIAFTICARNFFAYAITLYEAFTLRHPEATFYVALCDSDEDFDTSSFPFTVITLSELGLPDAEGMADRYSITEFNTAIKPFAFQALFDRHPGLPVLYLDPDIFVTSRFDEVLELTANGAECVLTPSITEPAEYAEFDDQQFLRYGAYNLGFCCLVGSPSVRRVVWWWARRLETACVVDLEAGLFVDQKWADLFPAFIEETHVLRHPGYNVAYWNLAQRRVRLDGDKWSVNGQPLRFFHFSGNVVEDDSVFSRHSKLFDVRNMGPAADLLSEFRAAVIGNGHAHFKTIPYAYGWDDERGENLHSPAALEQKRTEQSVRDPHLSVMAWHRHDEYREWATGASELLEERRGVEIAAIPHDEPFDLAGYCIICGEDRTFRTDGLYSGETLEDGRQVPNWREHLACDTCGYSNRQRAAYHMLKQELRPGRDSSIYMTEFVTDYFRLIAAEFPMTRGSEFLGDHHQAGELVDGVPHEDIQALSFADATFDVILSLDVLEHVPHETRAFDEMARTLRPGGKLLMTAPTRIDRDDNEVRAVLSDAGELTHLMEPEYHGNPVDAEGGSLCYRYYGWQVLDQLKHSGFSDAVIVTYWSERLRYFGEPQLAVLATR